jgi:ketosteroid isomerase-like protein
VVVSSPDVTSRLTDHEQIRQLVARYSVAIDSRDLDALVALYAADVDTRTPNAAVPEALGRGREAMRRYLDRGLRKLGRSAHVIGTHVIELLDDDRATGIVYAHVHEERFEPHHWKVVTLAYFDEYVHTDEGWLFAARRDIKTWWTDLIGHPDEADPVVRRPSPDSPASLPGAWPTWDTFWGPGGPPS